MLCVTQYTTLYYKLKTHYYHILCCYLCLHLFIIIIDWMQGKNYWSAVTHVMPVTTNIADIT